MWKSSFWISNNIRLYMLKPLQDSGLSKEEMSLIMEKAVDNIKTR